jgi:hypothetical protein
MQIHDLATGQSPAQDTLLLLSIEETWNVSGKDVRALAMRADAVCRSLAMWGNVDHSPLIGAHHDHVLGKRHLLDRLPAEGMLDVLPLDLLGSSHAWPPFSTRSPVIYPLGVAKGNCREGEPSGNPTLTQLYHSLLQKGIRRSRN